MLNKIQNYTKILTTFLLIGSLLLVPLASARVYAASSIYLNTASQNVNNGQTLNVNVLTDSDKEFNTAQVNLTFDSSKLKLTGVSPGNVLPKFVDKQQNSSSIKYTMYGTPGQSVKPGKNLVLLVASFKATASGSAAISLTDGTRTLIAGNTVATGAGAAITLNVSATATSTPTQTAAVEPDETQPLANRDAVPAPQSPVDKEAELEAAKADQTKPQFIKITQSGFVNDNVSIKIVTDEPTRATVKSGNATDQLLFESLSSGGLKGTYFVSLGSLSSYIQEGKPFYYQVFVTDAAGNVTESDFINIDTAGTTVSFTLKNPDGTLIKNRTVIVNGKEFKTNSDGIVTVKNLVPGSVNVSVIDENGQEVFLGELTAVEGVSDQVLGLVAERQIKDGSALAINGPTPIIVAVLGAIAILIIAGVIKRQLNKRKLQRLHSPNPYGGSTPNSTIVNPVASPISPVIQPTTPAGPNNQSGTATTGNIINPSTISQPATIQNQPPQYQTPPPSVYQPVDSNASPAVPGAQQAKNIVEDINKNTSQ